MADINAPATAIGSNGRGAAIDSHPVPLLPGQAARPMEDHPAWPMIARLPVMLAVSIPLRGFKVCNLLDLRCGQTVESAWASPEDVPLKVGSVQLGCGEFEVVEQRLALRLTSLA